MAADQEPGTAEPWVYYENPAAAVGHTVIPNWAFRLPLTPKAKLLFMTLLYHAQWNPMTWPGQDRLCKDCAVVRRTLYEALDELVMFGVLERQGAGRAARYRLMVPMSGGDVLASPSDGQWAKSAHLTPAATHGNGQILPTKSALGASSGQILHTSPDAPPDNQPRLLDTDTEVVASEKVKRSRLSGSAPRLSTGVETLTSVEGASASEISSAEAADANSAHCRWCAEPKTAADPEIHWLVQRLHNACRDRHGLCPALTNVGETMAALKTVLRNGRTPDEIERVFRHYLESDAQIVLNVGYDIRFFARYYSGVEIALQKGVPYGADGKRGATSTRRSDPSPRSHFGPSGQTRF